MTAQHQPHDGGAQGDARDTTPIVTPQLAQIWRQQRFSLGMLLRKSGTNNSAVIRAILDDVPREHFVQPPFLKQAYENLALPAGEGQTISAPEVVCQMTSALNIAPNHRVLEVGTGSGYQAAVLARMADNVFSIERFEALASVAQSRLRVIGADNVRQFVGDGSVGLPNFAPFDRIMLTAAPPEIPPALLDQLTLGGVLVAPVGKQSHSQHLVRCTKTAGGKVDTQVLGRVRFVPLVASLPQA